MFTVNAPSEATAGDHVVPAPPSAIDHQTQTPIGERGRLRAGSQQTPYLLSGATHDRRLAGQPVHIRKPGPRRGEQSRNRPPQSIRRKLGQWTSSNSILREVTAFWWGVQDSMHRLKPSGRVGVVSASRRRRRGRLARALRVTFFNWRTASGLSLNGVTQNGKQPPGSPLELVPHCRPTNRDRDENSRTGATQEP